MNKPYVQAPHSEGAKTPAVTAPNAALLIDFDNVTMGMRSDLSKELKTLLSSDVIKGKVTVQRAYADWRRYPQYIVPLSEASVDLIFAPAYGSSKKNATDIRMAIDAMELIFVRPEIGTYILLTGDSDFSSLVLKLKEYGKYVIGVGIQESSSDILVQNCDEYYSYTSLSGLRKTTEAEGAPIDPWVLVEKAVERMERRNDVMRSDRLKQVMLEIDSGFDEGSYGYSKFSKFLTEAKSRGLVKLKKLDNGQYEVRSTRSSTRGDGGGGGGRSSTSSRESRGGGRSRERRQEPRQEEKKPSRSEGGDPLKKAYDLLTRTVDRLVGDGKEAVRDSDVKRKMLEDDRSFDEGELGFAKFSRFLKQADDHGVIVLRKRDSGNYEVTLPETSGKEPVRSESRREEPRREAAGGARDGAPAGEEAEPEDAQEELDIPMVGAVEAPSPATGGREEEREEPSAPSAPEEGPKASRGEEEAAAQKAGETETRKDEVREEKPRGGLFSRVTRRGKKKDEGPPPLFEGQAVGASGQEVDAPAGRGPESRPERPDSDEVRDPDELGLPTDPEAVVRYLSNSYKGVGEKTAEGLVETFGRDLFRVLQESPERIEEAVPAGRADLVLEGWKIDYDRRVSRLDEDGEPRSGSGGDGQDQVEGRRTRRRGGRSRRRSS